LDSEKINDSIDLKDELKIINISDIYQKISGESNDKDEIQFKEYNFDLYSINLNKIITIDDSKEKEETLISNEKENEDFVIFKKNDLNLEAKNNDENKLNKIGRDNDYLINIKNSKVNKKENEKKEYLQNQSEQNEVNKLNENY
jgi:hypothetical protein